MIALPLSVGGIEVFMSASLNEPLLVGERQSIAKRYKSLAQLPQWICNVLHRQDFEMLVQYDGKVVYIKLIIIHNVQPAFRAYIPTPKASLPLSFFLLA